jgi:hypothetical protein
MMTQNMLYQLTMGNGSKAGAEINQETDSESVNGRMGSIKMVFGPTISSSEEKCTSQHMATQQ